MLVVTLEVVTGTCLIKCFTRSDFDHVAIVVRFPEPLGVRMLEACSPRSVMDKLYVVAKMVKSGRMYYRKLRKKDGSPLWTPEQENKLRARALELVGRPYENDMSQLVQAWSTGEGTWWSKIFGTDVTCDCNDYRKSGNRNKTDAEVEAERASMREQGISDQLSADMKDGKVDGFVLDDPETERELFCSELVAALY